MKKSIIAAGAASLAVAAMPIVGVFADTERTFTDIVELQNPNNCAMVVTAAATTQGIAQTTTYASGQEETEPNIESIKYAGTLTGGNHTSITGTKMTITCNDTGGWQINAAGTGTADDGESTPTSRPAYMDSDTNKASDDIPTSNTGTEDSDSYWNFQIALSGTNASSYATIASSYGSPSLIPSTSTKIVGKDAPIASTATVEVTPTYNVSFKPTQAAGTYTGKVTYTLIHPQQ